MNINIDITLNKWGLFEPFDGELFSSNDNIFNAISNCYKNYQYYIKTIKLSRKEYLIYYIPTVEYIKENPECKVEKYYTTTYLLIKYITENQKLGIWDINLSQDVINIDNFMWYYLGIGANSGIMNEIDLIKSNKFRETRRLLDKYSKK